MNSSSLAFIPKVYFPGAIYLSTNLEPILGSIKLKNPLIISSKNFLSSNKGVFKKLRLRGEIMIHTGEPTVSDLKKVEKTIKKKGVDSIIAVGGGSIIDLAKILKKERHLKLVAIPTTLGSSSEVSQFALISEKNKKVVIHSDELLPDVVIIDYELLNTLDQNSLIIQGIDALAHSLEALVSRLANPISDSLALISLEQIYFELLALKKNGRSREVLERLKVASTLSGFAQSSVGTGLIHALAHYFGPRNNIPHAKAVSIFFIDSLKVNLKNTDKYGKIKYLKTLSSKNILHKITLLFEDLGLKPQRIDFSGDLEKAANEIRSDATILTNPFLPSTKQLSDIIKNHI